MTTLAEEPSWTTRSGGLRCFRPACSGDGASWRQDDNGNRVRIDVFATVVEAEAAQAMYEARGHKQMYWVERPKDAEDTEG